MKTGIYVPFEGTAADLDKLRQQIEALQGVGEVQTVGAEEAGIKLLPRDPNTGKMSRTFYANGHKYTVVTDHIGIERYTQYEKLSISLGFGRTFKALYEYVVQGVNKINAETTVEGAKLTANKHFLALLDGIAHLGPERYSMAFYLACVFTLRDDEDIREFDADLQEEKIADWKAEGLSAQDLFFFASNAVDGLRSLFLLKLREQKEEQEKLLAALNISKPATSTGSSTTT